MEKPHQVIHLGRKTEKCAKCFQTVHNYEPSTMKCHEYGRIKTEGGVSHFPNHAPLTIYEQFSLDFLSKI